MKAFLDSCAFWEWKGLVGGKGVLGLFNKAEQGRAGHNITQICGSKHGNYFLFHFQRAKSLPPHPLVLTPTPEPGTD